jgi:hypothetical protein
VLPRYHSCWIAARTRVRFPAHPGSSGRTCGAAKHPGFPGRFGPFDRSRLPAFSVVFVRARSRGHPSPPTGRLLEGDPFGGAASGRASEAPSSASHRPADLCTRPSSYCSRSWRFRLFDCSLVRWFQPYAHSRIRFSSVSVRAAGWARSVRRRSGSRPSPATGRGKSAGQSKKPAVPIKRRQAVAVPLFLVSPRVAAKPDSTGSDVPFACPGQTCSRATSDPCPITGASVAAYSRPCRPVPRRRSQASFRLPSVASHRPATLLLPGIALLFLFRAFFHVRLDCV